MLLNFFALKAFQAIFFIMRDSTDFSDPHDIASAHKECIGLYARYLISSQRPNSQAFLTCFFHCVSTSTSACLNKSLKRPCSQAMPLTSRRYRNARPTCPPVSFIDSTITSIISRSDLSCRENRGADSHPCNNAVTRSL